MSVDAEYERFKRAAEEAQGELGDDGPAPARDAIRNARFELTVMGPRQPKVEQEIAETFGPFLKQEIHRLGEVHGEMMAGNTYTWDVEDPTTAGPAARNISVTAAAESKRDAYLVWHAMTGFPMLYDPGR